ncbi:MAG: cytochrome c biogenesis protein CcsA [Candidatus Dormibacteraceae bacterium]
MDTPPATDKLTLAAAVAFLALLGAGAMIFLYAPMDALQGNVQRIFYFHVASVIAAYFCFAAVLVGGVLYLWKRSPRADRIARSAAPVGLLLTTVCLVMGSIWAKPIWGTYWTWDARLTSTLVLWMVYAGYLLVRRLASDQQSAARLAAVVGIVGFIDVPLVHVSVEWWRTIHPQPILDSTQPNLPPQMTVTFLVTLAAITLLAAVLVGARYQIDAAREALATLRDELDETERAAVPGAPVAASWPIEGQLRAN